MDEGLRWRIGRWRTEAVQHRQKAAAHSDAAEALELRIAKAEELLRQINARQVVRPDDPPRGHHDP